MIPVSLNSEDCNILEANCTIDDGYTIIMGDERFYRAFGDNTMYTLDRLMHEDDRETFVDFIINGDESTPILVRCQLKDIYRWVLIYKKRVENRIDDGELIELHFYDVLVQRNKFSLYYNNVRKYRSMLTHIKDRIFEYDFATGEICIYFYVDGRSEIIERDLLDEWQKRMIRLGYVKDTQIEIFNNMCDDIRSGVDSFSCIFQSTIMSKGGRRDTLNFRGETLVDGASKTMVVGLISEIGGRIEQKAILYDNNEVNKDSATGLLNKKAVTDDIMSTIKNAKESGSEKPMWLLIYDIDDFKSVNDTYGHYFGDEVIMSFATELQRTVGSRGITGRIGGDEFITLLTDFEDVDEVKDFLKTVRKRPKLKLAERKHDYMFSVSIGISQYPKDGSDYEALFKIADGALYIAKEKGKDRYILYTKELHGDLINEDVRRVGLNDGTEFMKPIEKCELASNLMINVLQEGRKAIIPALEELMDRMNIHGISIYDNYDDSAHMKCKYVMGQYSKRLEYADYVLDKKYQECFDDHGINTVNNITSLAIDFPELYQRFKEYNICSVLQMFANNDEKGIGMISFDTFGEHRRKWSKDDISTIYMVVKAIAKADEK